MLIHLSVKNYALIESINIDLSPGLTAITGETGSGKSILIGAIGLILGQRADLSSLRNPEVKCIVEATFKLDKDKKKFFKKHDLDFDEFSLIRREITPGGKSRAFVNDTPVGLNILKEFAKDEVEIHSQHDNSLLRENQFRFSVLDQVARQTAKFEEYEIKLSEYTSSLNDLKKIKTEATQNAEDIDYVQFQLNELSEAQLDGLDQEKMTQELQELDHSSDIIQSLSASNSILSENSDNVVGAIHQVIGELSKISHVHQKSEELLERVNSVKIELEDIVSDIEQSKDKIEIDPQQQMILQSKLDQVFKLQQKHKVTTIDDLIEVRELLDQKLQNTGSFEERIKQLEAELESKKEVLTSIAQSLSKGRQKAADTLCSQIQTKLASVGMKSAELSIQIDASNDFNEYGMDQMNWLFSANVGSTLQPIEKIASGGEQSRMMLAIKSELAQYTKIPTLILDEIDTGISGEVALRVAELMNKMSSKMQLFAITHLPQIAAKGTCHLKVSKTSDQLSTYTHLETLDFDGRVKEIAEMMSGKDTSEAALESARVLLSN